MNNTSCSSDPFSTRLLMSHLYAIVPILQHIVNLCLTTGDFPISCKSSIVIPLIKKPGLDREMLKKYRPVSNLSFLSKVIEKVISIRILGHILDNNIVDRFQSAHRAGHSCETAFFYADDTQLYISFKCKDPLESLTRLNMCISDIRVWMIKNKLKINDSKTDFIIFRSPLLKQNLSDLSVSVGDMQVSPSSKVRDLGVVFDQYLTFHDHISGICKSTHFHLRGIGRIRNLLTFDATAQLIHVTPFDAFKKRVKTHLYLKYFAN